MQLVYGFEEAVKLNMEGQNFEKKMLLGRGLKKSWLKPSGK